MTLRSVVEDLALSRVSCESLVREAFERIEAPQRAGIDRSSGIALSSSHRGSAQSRCCPSGKDKAVSARRISFLGKRQHLGQRYLSNTAASLRNTSIANHLNLPSICFPLVGDKSIPASAMIIGPRNEDAMTLAIANHISDFQEKSHDHKIT